MYPISLDVRGRRVVVVGGGPVAARRVAALVDEGADVAVVAPYVCEDLADLIDEGQVSWTARDYTTGDLAGAWLAHTATGVDAIDTAVAAEAEAGRVWCVRASDASASSAWTPAVARVDDVVVAVTGGADPRRAMRIRDAVREQLSTGRLPIRRQRRRDSPGHVALVGGGPGDPGLITARGRRLLAEADVVVVDRLAPRALLDDLDDDVDVIDVGKTPGRHPVPQSGINEILVEEARRGRRVVRLKGGDPFVLGRGGEEAEACRAAGIEVTVVPGVTSAVAVPAAAGIPVTHRGLAKQFTVVSGHAALDWSTLAATEGTLVFLMAVRRLRATATALVDRGMPMTTPVGIIEDGYGPAQRLTTGTLADIADRADAVGVTPPAVVVVGDVVSLAAGVTGTR